MHRRNEVEVGVQRVEAGVHQDHADAARFRTARLLLVRAFTPRSHTTILPATLAGSSTATPRVVGLRKTECLRRIGIGAWCAGDVGSISERRADGGRGERRAVDMSRRCRASPSPGRCGCACRPRPSSIHGHGCATVMVAGPSVARRGGDEDARVGREQERHLRRIEEVGLRAADRVVDHVHAVGDSLIDRGDEVRR